MSRSSGFVLAAALGLLLTACGSPAAPGGPAPAFDGGWRLVSAADAEGALPLDGVVVTLLVEGANAGGTGGCNTYGTALSTTDGVRFDPPTRTEMACDPPVVLEVENRYLDALARVDAATTGSGELQLTGPGIELSFEQIEPIPQDELTAVGWRLVSVLGAAAHGAGDADADGAEPDDPGDAGAASALGAAGIRFMPDEDDAVAGGTVEGTGGCRAFTGRYSAENGELNVFDLTVAEPAAPCSAELSAQDDAVLAVLGTAVQVRLDDRGLLLTGSSGTGALEFVAEP